MRRMLLNISGIQRFFLLFKGFNNFLYYNISNYFLDKQGLAVMHPDKNLEKTNMRERRDPQGFAFIQDILKKSNQVNQGRTKYTWNKNGFSDPVLKLVRFKNFQPWDLVIVNGIYLDTVRNLMWEHAVKFIIIFIISIFSMAILIF